MALDADTTLNLGQRNQLKVGFGSFTTPYIAGAFSFGDGKKNLLNLYGNYISSRGNIKNQDFSELNLKAAGSIFTPTNEIYANAAFSQHEYICMATITSLIVLKRQIYEGVTRIFLRGLDIEILLRII